MAHTEHLTGWRLVLAWIALAWATCAAWWVIIMYVCLPAIQAIGGLFRMAAIR